MSTFTPPTTSPEPHASHEPLPPPTKTNRRRLALLFGGLIAALALIGAAVFALPTIEDSMQGSSHIAEIEEATTAHPAEPDEPALPQADSYSYGNPTGEGGDALVAAIDADFAHTNVLSERAFPNEGPLFESWSVHEVYQDEFSSGILTSETDVGTLVIAQVNPDYLDDRVATPSQILELQAVEILKGGGTTTTTTVDSHPALSSDYLDMQWLIWLDGDTAYTLGGDSEAAVRAYAEASLATAE